MDNRAPRYRLQRRESYAMPNILGGHPMPVHTYRWRDIAASGDKQTLEAFLPPGDNGYRVIDTQMEALKNDSNT